MGNEKALWTYSRGSGGDGGNAGVLKPKSKKNLEVKYISEWKLGGKWYKFIMGTVIDEETGDEPTCIFCNSNADCEHLVAIIDKTFSICNGGAIYEHIYNLKEFLSEIIAGLKETTGLISEHELGLHFPPIYQAAVDSFNSKYPDYFHIDSGKFVKWLIAALIDAGAEESPGHFVEEGGPGQSSALCYLYAQNSKVVVESVINTLNDIRLKFNPTTK